MGYLADFQEIRVSFSGCYEVPRSFYGHCIEYFHVEVGEVKFDFCYDCEKGGREEDRELRALGICPGVHGYETAPGSEDQKPDLDAGFAVIFAKRIVASADIDGDHRLDVFSEWNDLCREAPPVEWRVA